MTWPLCWILRPRCVVVEYGRCVYIVSDQMPVAKRTLTGCCMVPEHQVPHNIVELEDLNDASLLESVKKRYKKDLIYTYVGDVLLAVNPYKRVPIYGEKMKNVFDPGEHLPYRYLCELPNAGVSDASVSVAIP